MWRPAKPRHRPASDRGDGVEPPSADEDRHRPPPRRHDGVVPPDEIVAAVAARRRGIAGIGDLRAAGLTRHEVASRVRRGWLHPRHRGVFSVGHLGEIPLAREAAALMACGAGAALSHRSAAAVWGLLDVPDGVPVDVSVPRRRDPRHDGIAVHRVDLRRRDVRMREGLAVTSVARTIADLAVVLQPAALERLIAEALARRLVRRGELVLPAGAPGAARLRHALDTGPRFTRSEAERVLLALVRKAGLPLPETNVRLAGMEVDALWREQRVAVEIDGFAFHSDRRAFEADRRRDQRLTRAGYAVVRVTWRQLVEEPERLVALLADLLARRGGAA